MGAFHTYDKTPITQEAKATTAENSTHADQKIQPKPRFPLCASRGHRDRRSSSRWVRSVLGQESHLREFADVRHMPRSGLVRPVGHQCVRQLGWQNTVIMTRGPQRRCGDTGAGVRERLRAATVRVVGG